MKKFLVFGFLIFYSFLIQAEESTVIIGEGSFYTIDSYEKASNIPFLSEQESGTEISWYQLSILNKITGSDYLLEFIDFRIDDIEIYIPDQRTNNYVKFRTGDYYPFHTRPIPHKNFIFELPPIYNQPYTVYFKTRKHTSSNFVVRANIRTFSGFSFYSLNEYTFLSFFYGILFCMTVYNFVRFIFTRERIYLTYVLYIIALTFFSLSRIDGLGFEFLWPNFPVINEYSFQVSLTLFVVLSLSFATSFLDLKKKNPVLYKYIIVWMVVRILLTGLILVVMPNLDLKIPDLLIMAILIISGFKTQTFKKSPTRFSLTAYSCMFTGFLIYTFQDYALIKNSFIAYYSLNWGVFAETILLSVAISEKTKMLMVDRQEAQNRSIQLLQTNKYLQNQLIQELREKEKIKDKVNRELEAKVRERTEELNEKNKVLQEQKLKIENLAGQIDKQYYELKKESNNQKLNLIWTKHLSYIEFKEVFPDEQSCLNYLEKLKWNINGYECKKCNHTKFLRNPSNMNRKCSRCTHIESVTANTLFHGIKFSLQKAFYLTYCCIHGIEDTTLTSLALNLDLRLNTCCSFVSKVQSRMRKTSSISGESTFQSMFLPEKK